MSDRPGILSPAAFFGSLMAQGALPSAYTKHLLDAAQAGQVSSNIEDVGQQSPEDRLIDMGQGYASGYRNGGSGTALKFVSSSAKGGMSDPTVVKTIIHEAGPDPKAQAAVAYVIRNRAEQTGKSPLEVVKQRGQFEGYSNPGYGAVKAANDPKIRAAAEQVARQVAAGTIADPTGGGSMFHADSMTPYWAKSANKNGTVNIGGNVFYKGTQTPQTALAAIDRMVAPNPQSRPPALAYAPPGVRAFSVNPDGSPLLDVAGLNSKTGLNFTPSGSSASAITGFQPNYSALATAMGKSPPTVPPAVQRVASAPQSLITHPVQPVAIGSDGQPILGQRYAPSKPAAPTVAVNVPSVKVPTTPIRATINPPTVAAQPSLRDQTAAEYARITGGQNASKLADYGSGAGLAQVAKNMPFFGPVVGGAQALGDMLSGRANAAPPPVISVAPTAAPRSTAPTQAQMQAIRAVPVAPKPLTPGPTEAQLRAIRNVPPSIPSQVYTKPPAQITTSPGGHAVGHIATGKDTSQLPSVTTAYAPIDLMAGDTPAVKAATALSNPRIAPVPHPYPIRLPTVPVRSVGPQPLTKFLPPNQRQNDTLTTLGNHAGNFLAGTPMGHIYSLLTGGPNTGGGILNGLFGYGGLFGGQPASAPPPIPQRTGPDPLQAAVHAALMNGETYDRSRDPSFNPNGGANGGSYSH